MDVVSSISTVISLAKTTAETVNRLRLAYEINEGVKTRLDTLHERSNLFQENFHSIKDKFDDKSNTLPQEKCNHVKLQVGVVSELIEEVNSALTSVKTSAPPGSSSNALRRSWWRTKMSVKTAFNISSITEKLDTAKSKLQEAISNTTQIMIYIDLKETTNVEGGASSSRGGVFQSHFARPELPQHVVLDYTPMYSA